MNRNDHSQPGKASDEVLRLADACLSDDASDTQYAELERLVTTDEASRCLYFEYIRECALLHEIAQDRLPIFDVGGTLQSLLSDVGEDNTPASLLAAEGVNVPAAETTVATVDAGSRWTRRLAMALSVVAATVVIGIGVYTLRQPAPVVSHRIAKLRHTKDAVWSMEEGEIPPSSGDWLVNGQYTLEEGIAQLTFPWGTELTLEGPTQIELQSGNLRQLLYGQVVATVGPDDSGFTIDTPTVKVIDIGTEFGINVDSAGNSEVHVFKGEVETRQLDGPHRGALLQSTLLAAGHAVRFGSDQSQEVIFNPARFVKAWREASHVQSTRGSVRFIHPQPPSVREGALESNDTIQLFIERKYVTLPDITAVTITQPGLYTTFAERSVLLPPGLQVDSYLLHFDPIGSEKTLPPVSAEGTVVFDRPILGIIARGDQLSAADSSCAHPDTQYLGFPRRNGKNFIYQIRGLVGAWNDYYHKTSPAPNDRLRLSLDRKTLSVQLAAGGEADQIRILVAAAGSVAPVTLESPAVISPPRPYHGRPFLVNERIEAEDFDRGGEGVAWFDSTPNSVSRAYRPGVGVELASYLHEQESTDETTTSVHVGGTRSGEWLTYTIDIKEAGTYRIKSSVWSNIGGGTFHAEFGEDNQTEAIEIPRVQKPGQDWCAEVVSGPITLEAGRQIMRIVMDDQYDRGWVGNINWLQIVPADPEPVDPR